MRGTVRESLADGYAMAKDWSDFGTIEPAKSGADEWSKFGDIEAAEKPKEQGDKRSFFRTAADLGTSFAQGAVDVNRAVAAVGGADNPIAEGLGAVGEGLNKHARSDYARARREEHARLAEKAADEGMGAEAWQAVKNFADAPGDYAAQGVGSVAGLYPALKTAGLSAARMGLGPIAAKALQFVGVGAPVGVGATKLSQHEEVYNYLREQGVPEDVARAKAAEAQSYGADNALQHGIGATLGGIDVLTGGEAVMMGGKKRLLDTIRSRGVNALRRGSEEFGTEALQGGHEKFAGNLAAIDAGDAGRDPKRGVVGAGVQEGLMGFSTGATMGAFERGKQADDVAPPAEQPALAAADALGVPGETQPPAAQPTEAEKALYAPKSLTALDRVAEIDAQLQATDPNDITTLDALLAQRETLEEAVPAAPHQSSIPDGLSERNAELMALIEEEQADLDRRVAELPRLSDGTVKVEGGTPISSIPSHQIAQRLTAAETPETRHVIATEMQRRGLEVPVLPPLTGEAGKAVAILQKQVEVADPFTEQHADLSARLTNTVAVDAQAAIDGGEMPAYRAKNGLVVTVSPSAQNPGKLQVTRYDEGKGVIGDSQYNSVEDAIRQEGISNYERMPAGEVDAVLSNAAKAEVEYQKLRAEVDAPAGRQPEVGADNAAVQFIKRGDFWNYSGDRAQEVAKALDLPVMKVGGVSTVGIPENARKQLADTLQAAGIPASFELPESTTNVRTTPRKRPASDSLIQAIINRGGINRSIMSDVGGDKGGRYQPGLFTNNGTADLSELAQLLFDEDGFHQINQASDIGPARELEELIGQALGGERILNTDAMERDREAEMKERHKQEVIKLADEYGVSRTSNPRNIETLDRRVSEAIIAEISNAGGIAQDTRNEALAAGMTEEDVSAIEDAIAGDDEFNGRDQPRDAMVKMWRKITKTLKERINDPARSVAQDARGRPDQARDVAEAGNEEGREDARAEGRAADPEAGAAAERPALDLEAQSEADLAAKAAREADEGLANREIADSEREAFTLAAPAGSAAPKAVPSQQGNMFNAAGEAKQAAQPKPAKVGAGETAKKADAPAVDADQPTDGKIADEIGEHLAGSRKDKAAALRDAVTRELSDDDIATQPLSKIWPKESIDQIEDPFIAAVAHAARAEIPSKPRKGYKVAGWAKSVKTLRELTGYLLRGNVSREEFAGKLKDGGRALEHFGAKVAVLESIDRANWDRIGKVEEYPDAFTYDADGKQIRSPIVRVTIDDKSLRFDAKSVADVIDKVQAALGEAAKQKKMEFEVRGQSGRYAINKKGDKLYRKLKTFETSKEALDYKKSNYDDLVAAWEAVKDSDNVKESDVRSKENRPRTAQDWRSDLSRSRVLQALIKRGDADAKMVSDLLIRHSATPQGNGGSNIPSPFGLSDWPDSADSVNANLRKRPSYMTVVSLNLLRNIAEANSLSVEGYSKINIPTRRAMMNAMLALGHNNKVVDSVIGLIPVDVMNLLAGEKISPEMLFHDKSVLKDALSVEGGMPVSDGERLEAVLAFVRHVAGSGAEVVGANDPARVALEGDTALMTGKVDSGIEKSLFSHDVTPEEFMATFSHKGIEFGNWVSQGAGGKDRQGMLNQAYDALMDLSDIIGVPPKAMSLNGSLGLGFGSRGSGKFAAHFEPDMLVINLTKTRGAGSLAHEWFHALDNYFQSQRGKGYDYITNNPENYYVHKQSGQKLPARAFSKMIEGERDAMYGTIAQRYRDRAQWELQEGVRTEVAEAFADLVKALNESPMAKRASLIDKGKSGGYWSRIIERGARSFENYVIHKMMLKGYSNDYLANVVSIEDFARDEGRYPYLLEGEIAPVAEAFDNLFNTIQTKETAQGVTMFSRSGTARESFAATFLQELTASEPDVFRYPTSKSSTLSGVFKDVFPGVEYYGEHTRVDEKEESGADHRFVFTTPESKDGENGKRFNVYTTDAGRVWIDVQHLQPGDQGSRIYHAVANYAYNARKVFGGDPIGVSPDAIIARMKMMLTSVLRYGTARHLDASKEQEKGMPDAGIEPLDWSGNDIEKLRNLIHTVSTTAANRAPKLNNFHYDFSKQGIFDGAGKPVSKLQLLDATRAGQPGASGIGADFGRAAILIQSLVSAESRGAGDAGILQALLNNSRSIVEGGLRGALSRGAGHGMSYRDLQAVVDRMSPHFKNLPRVHVLESPAGLSTKDLAQKALRDFIRKSDAWTDVEGATHDGEIYLFASGMADEARAEHVFATHEVTHYGLRGAVGKELDAGLQHIWLHNTKVRKAAAAVKKARGLKSNVEAIEEVLADMPSAELAKLTGWRAVVKRVRNWLKKIGAEKLAARLDAWINAGLSEQQQADLFVAEMVTAAREWVRTGNGKADMSGTRLADPTLADDMARQEKWLAKEAKARGYQSIDELAEKAYPVFENLAALWRKKNPVEVAMLSRSGYAFDDGILDYATADQVIDGARLKELRRSAARLEKPRTGTFLQVTEDGRAIATGEKGTRIPETFIRFAQQNGLRFEARRIVPQYGNIPPANMNISITKKSEPMPIEYRESGALYFGEGGASVDRTGKTRFSRAASPAPTSAPAHPPAPGNPWQAAKAKAAAILTPERIDRAIYEFQDKMIDLKRLRDHIKDIGGVINDLNDAYMGEELYHKRVAKRTEDFLAKEVKPLLADMRFRAISIEEMETYLHARHAPEANAEMAKRNPNQAEIDAGRKLAADEVKALELQLQAAQSNGGATKSIEQALNEARGKLSEWNGAQAFRGTEAERLSLSGMSDADAAKIMAGLAPGKRVHLAALAAKVDAMNAKTLDELEKYGLMDKASLDAWRNAYQHYAPLHRDEAHPDSASHPIGQGYSTKGDASKQRTGSNAKVTHILGHIAMQREAALTRGEKNHVMRRLYLMAKQNPLKDVWSIDKIPTIETIDKKTGFVKAIPDPLHKMRPNVLMLRIAGKDVAITMNENNPEAVRMAAALKNLDVDDLHYIIPTVAKATRWFASVNTQYNPIFGIVNFTRDIQAAMLQLSTTEIAGRQGEVFKDTMAIMKQVLKSGGRMPKAGQWGALFDEMQNVGGTTGYRDLFLNAEDRANSLLKELKSLERGKVSQAAHAVVEWLSDYNEAMENAVRLAAYKAAIDNGMTKERAASLAKNLTVNFNRKGRQTREIGALYAFFNAAVQGTTRMAQTLAGPAGKKIMAGGVAVGALSALMGMAMMGDGDDDEYAKIPEFIKERALIFPVSKDSYIAIPMPLGFHFLPNIGRLAVEMFAYKDKTIGKQVVSMFSVMAEAFNPLGGSAPALQMAMPTVLDPFVALAENKDWTGKAIYLENYNNLDPEPGHRRTKDSATAWSKAFSEAINAITGGTQYTPGAWSPTPDQIDYVIGQLTGGVGREIGKLATSVQAPFTGDELPPHKLPLVGRFYGNTSGPSGQSEKFYENIKLANQHENEIVGRLKDGKPTDDYLKENPSARELAARGNVAEAQVRKLRSFRKEIARRDEPDAKNRKEEINHRIAAIMKGLNHEAERLR